MSDFKIEKNVPTPEPYGHGLKSRLCRALGELEVGDSFEVGVELQRAARTHCSNFASGTSKKFTWRKTRVWRIQ